MSPFKALNVRKFCTSINWSDPETKLMLGLEMLAKIELEVRKIRKKLRVAQDQHKIYTEKKRTYWECEVGDHVYVRIKPNKNTLRWVSCAKLAPRFCGPFQILERVGSLAYGLALPSHIWVQNVFHMSLLKRYVHDMNHVIHWQNIHVGIIRKILTWKHKILYEFDEKNFFVCR